MTATWDRQPLDRLVGQLAGCRDFVDALRQQVQALHHLADGAVFDQFLDLPRQRGDARLDPLERLGIEMRGRRGRRRCDDRPRDLVEPLLDDVERRAAAAVLLAREMIDRAGQRAHLLLQRTQRQQFGKAVDGLVDLLEPQGQRLDCRIGCARMRLRVETILEFAEAGVEIVPAPVDRAHRVLARQRVERTAHLLQLEAQQLDALVVGLFGQRLDGAGQPLEFGAELGAVLGGQRRGCRRARCPCAARRIRAPARWSSAGAVLRAGPSARRRSCRPAAMLSSWPRTRSIVARQRLIGRLAFRHAWHRCARAAVVRTVPRDAPALPSGQDCAGQASSRSPRARPVGQFVRVAADALLQRFQRAVELLDRAVRPALPTCIQGFEIGPFAVHRNARLSIAAGDSAGFASKFPAGNGRRLAKSLRRKASSGAVPPPSESREQFDTG